MSGEIGVEGKKWPGMHHYRPLKTVVRAAHEFLVVLVAVVFAVVQRMMAIWLR